MTGTGSPSTSNTVARAAAVVVHAVDRGHDLDAKRRRAKPDDASRIDEQLRFERRQVEAERAQRLHEALGVVRRRAHPDVEIDRGSWVAVQADGIAANEEVVNAVRVE